MRNAAVALALVGSISVLIGVSSAKAQQCDVGKYPVPTANGVQCQAMPACPAGTVVGVDGRGFACQIGNPATPQQLWDAAHPPQNAEEALKMRQHLEEERQQAKQEYTEQSAPLPQDRNKTWYAFAEIPAVDKANRPVTDQSDKPIVDGICMVWKNHWTSNQQFVNYEADQVTRWYKGWKFKFDFRNSNVTIYDLSVPDVQNGRRVGSDKLTHVSVTVPVSTTRPEGCTAKWVKMWEQTQLAWHPELAPREAPSNFTGIWTCTVYRDQFTRKLFRKCE